MSDPNLCANYHADDRPTGRTSTTGSLRWPTAVTTAAKSARTTASGCRRGRRSEVAVEASIDPTSRRRPGRTPGRRLSTFLFRRPRLRPGRSAAPPRSAGSGSRTSARSRCSSSRRSGTRPVHHHVVHEFSLDNFRTLLEEPVYRTITLRTLGMAICSDDHRCDPRLPDRLLHGARRVTSRTGGTRRRGADAPVGELPREGLCLADILAEDGVLNWVLEPVGLQVRVTRQSGSGSSSRISGSRS